ncbi:MAG: polyhydroxyalkanoic acid system family protein [Bdellovibrionaceae bacterium]|nr:polyhydroxyalkanoic acid system family protein [Pseudobdellovibrionaceae bacterium]
MPKFSIDHQCPKDTESTYQRLKELLTSEVDLTRYDAKSKLTFDDGKRCASVQGGQFNAALNVTPVGTGSKITISVDLPLLLLPFKGKVQESLEKMLKKYFS